MISGNDLKKLRLIDLNWSQVKFAKEMGISQSVLSSVENGLVQPTTKFMDKLKKLLKKHKKTIKSKPF